MSKPMAVTVPIILLVLDCFALDRFRSLSEWIPLLKEKISFFILSFIIGIVTLLGQKMAGAMVPIDAMSLLDRIMNTVRNLSFYIEKTLWPDLLSPFYPFQEPWKLASIWFASCLIMWFAITAFCWHSWKRGRSFWMGSWLYYQITVAPVIGFVQVGRHSAADRYTYLPTLPIYILAGLGLLWLWKRWNQFPAFRGALILIIAVMASFLISATHSQIKIWNTSESLWRHSINIYPGKLGHVHRLLGDVLKKEDRLEEAELEFKTALSINPNIPQAYNGLGLVFLKKNSVVEAERMFAKGLKIWPAYQNALNNLGIAYLLQNKYQEAQSSFRQLLNTNPDNANAYGNLGSVYDRLGEFDQAEAAIKQGLALEPQQVDLNFNLGSLYYKMGHLKRSENQFNKVLELNPNYIQAYIGLGNIYTKQEKFFRAETEFKMALKIDPGHPLALRNLIYLQQINLGPPSK